MTATTTLQRDRRVGVGAPPLVTVIVCTYNAGEHLVPAVRSVLEQTHTHLEVLVVDDGSTDGSVECLEAEIEDRRVRILRQANAGKPAAMNRALDAARGEFYVIQDADDLSYPERVERQLARLQSDPELAGVFCGYDLILDGERIAPRTSGRSRAECGRLIAEFKMPGHDPTAMYRMSAVAGERYETEFRIGEGLDYILRIGERAPLAVCAGVLYSYRVELDGLTKADPHRRNEYVRRVLRRACERRGLDTADAPAAVHARARRRLRQRDRDNNLAAHFMESVVDLRVAGERAEAIRIGWRCAKLWPWSAHYWKALAYALLPWSWVLQLRSR